MRHCCTQRPRFRGFIPLPVGVDANRFLGFNVTLALLGFASLGRSPSLPLGLWLSRATSTAHAGQPADRPDAFRCQATVAARRHSSQALQERTPFGSCSLCFKVSKSWEVG